MLTGVLISWFPWNVLKVLYRHFYNVFKPIGSFFTYGTGQGNSTIGSTTSATTTTTTAATSTTTISTTPITTRIPVKSKCLHEQTCLVSAGYWDIPER